MFLWSLAGDWINLRDSEHSWAYAAALAGRSSLGFAGIWTVKAWLWSVHQGISTLNKKADGCMVSPWYDFTQLIGIRRHYHVRAQRPSADRPAPTSALVCPALMYWENWYETLQLLARTSWEDEDLYQPSKCLSDVKRIYYDKFLNRDPNEYTFLFAS